MNEDVLARAASILKSEPSVFLSVEELWQRLREEGLAQETTLTAFEGALANDERFEFLDTPDPRDHADVSPTSSALAQALERSLAGLDSQGSRHVKLSQREMSVESIFAGLSHSLQEMNQALQSTWESRPDDDQETEDRLLEIMAAGQRLEKEVDDLVKRHQEEKGSPLEDE